jgi:hypothetical protein
MQLVTGIIWLVQAWSYGPTLEFQADVGRPYQLPGAISIWIPSLGFSAGLDTIMTSMIAGRLIYHHRIQKKLGGVHTSPYIPLVTIVIESAALSLISKIIQLSIFSIAIELNPLVIPLCVSKELSCNKVQDTHF